MDKEEILERSRRENEKLDERERDALAASGKMAFLVGGIICVLIIVLEWNFRRRIATEIWAVYASMYGTNELIQFSTQENIAFDFCLVATRNGGVFFRDVFYELGPVKR